MKNIFLLVFSIINIIPCMASDHLDGPVTSANRVADLTDLYAFPTPGKPGYLSIILNAYPLVGATGHYTDKVNYNIMLRRAAIKGAGDRAYFDTSDEVSINCTFKTPAITADHVVSCKGSNGIIAENKYDLITEKQEGDDFRLYAGMRSDPFFFNAVVVVLASYDGILLPPFLRLDSDIMKHANILSIVMEVEVKKLFKGNPPSLIALAAETTTQDSPTAPIRRIDRVGRPEITNVSMVNHKSEADIRDQYNQDRPFQVPRANQQLYQDRLAKNIAFYDSIDHKKDWSDADREELAAILADDFLVVDMSKPCENASFFDIEKALIRHRPHETCGGRRPNDDIMATIFTMYIAGLDGKKITDGVDHPSRPVSDRFPYLAEPDLSLAARVKAALAKELLKITE